jgi:hypothetical protein
MPTTEKLDVVRRKFPPVGRVRGEHAEGLVPRGNRHGHAADHAQFIQQRRVAIAGFLAPVVDDGNLAGLGRP